MNKLVSHIVAICIVVIFTTWLGIYSATTAQASTCYTFTTNHGTSDAQNHLTTAEATALKAALVAEGLWNAGTALTTYNSAVSDAIKAFQEKYASAILAPNGMTQGNGFLGDYTRIKLNSLYGCTTGATGSGSSGGSGATGASQCPTGYVCTLQSATSTRATSRAGERPYRPGSYYSLLTQNANTTGSTTQQMTAAQIQAAAQAQAQAQASTTSTSTPNNAALLNQQITQLTSQGSAYADYYASNSNEFGTPAIASSSNVYYAGFIGCRGSSQGCNSNPATVNRLAVPAYQYTSHTRGTGGGWDGSPNSPYLAYTGCIVRGDCAVLVANAIYHTPELSNTSLSSDWCPKDMAVVRMGYGGTSSSKAAASGSSATGVNVFYGGHSTDGILCLHYGDPTPPAILGLDPYQSNGPFVPGKTWEDWESANRGPGRPAIPVTPVPVDPMLGEASKNNPYRNPWITGNNFLGIITGTDHLLSGVTEENLSRTNLCENPVTMKYAGTRLKSMFAINPTYQDYLLSSSTLFVRNIDLYAFEDKTNFIQDNRRSIYNANSQSDVEAIVEANIAANCSGPCMEFGAYSFLHSKTFSMYYPANDWYNPTFQAKVNAANIQFDGNGANQYFPYGGNTMNGGFGHLYRCLDQNYKSNFPAYSKFFTEALQRAKTAGWAI